MRKLLTFLSFSFLSLLRSQSFRRKVFQISYFIFTFTLSILTLSPSGFSKEKVQYLKKVGEIKEGFSSEKENFFIKITGLCCDDEGNLYVADSGWNKIFKFDPNGKFIMSFGRQGQGPGEFLAHPMRAHLKISFGNDGKLYVNDPGNGRLSIFSKEGKFIKSFKLPPFTYDAPVVNSKGDIYLLSKSGIKVIDCYDSNFKYKASLLDIEEHLKFPFGKPFIPVIELRKPTPPELIKTITKNDELILVSNYAFKVFLFNRGNEKINEFNIYYPEIIKNYKARITKTMENENRKRKTRTSNISGISISKVSVWVYPFIFVYTDLNNRIVLLYFDDSHRFSIYKYTFKGILSEKLIFKEKMKLAWNCLSINKFGFLFINGDNEKIWIYIYKN